MKVTVKTIGGLHYLYVRDRSLRQCYLPHQKSWAESVADRLSKGSK
jgi:hypothetical protein